MGTDNAVSPNATGLTGRAFSGTAWSALSTVGKQVLSFASLSTVARILGPGAYGLMGMAGLVIAFIANFRDLGTASAIIQRSSVSRRLLSSLFWINVGVGAVMFSLIMAIAPFVSDFFHAPVLTNILRVFAISLFFASCGVVHNAMLNRNMSFGALAAIDLVASLISFGVSLGCAYSGLGVWSLVFANVTNSLLSTGGYWAVTQFRPHFEFDLTEVKSIAKFSSNLTGFGIVNYAYRNTDNVIVGKFLGSAALGFYQMAYNMMLLPIQNISSVIAQVLFPAFSRIQDDDERFRNAFIRGCMLIALVTFPVMAGLGVIADPLIRAVLGPKWAGTIPIFQVLAPVGLLQSVPTGIIFQAKGRTDLMLRWGLLALITLTAAFLIGVHFGAVGVAVSYAIAYAGILMLPGFLLCFRLIGLKLRTFAAALLPQLLLTLGMTTVGLGWLYLLTTESINNVWFRALSTSIVGAVIYIAGLFIFRLRVLDYLEEVFNASENVVILRISALLARRRAA